MLEQRQRIQAGAVMMNLTFDALDLPAVEEIPISSSVAIPAPVRDRWHEA